MCQAPDVSDLRNVRIAVVGPCASGKTTLVEQLRARGYDAWATAQEHSAIPNLWNHQQPDLLVALRADLDTIRARRGEHWPKAVYEAQQERLENAYQAADLVIDTGTVPKDDTVAMVIAYLRHEGVPPHNR